MITVRGNAMRRGTCTILSKKHADIIQLICKGCIFYKPKDDVTLICSIMGWYVDVLSETFPFDEFIKNLKGCPCNQKCLVKPVCVENCPEWLAYLGKLIDNKLANVRK